ncbi:DUF4365 domain-containing protein [Peredibacter sp. HCB2-198]|uniref:DUF4365 domain-containing protein n=1 Tax=Peredibacter sp. HCB2-198 TaxID=3383025 RepID=UPI0038B42EA8
MKAKAKNSNSNKKIKKKARKKKSTLPKYNETDQRANEGVNLVEGIILRKIKWIFRRQLENDLGIDAQIEVKNDLNEGTGRLIALQIKAGQHYLKHETPDGFTYYGEVKHLNYWLNHSLPVLVVLCDLDNDCAYWVQVTRLNVSKNKEGWSVLVPKKNLLQANCSKEFLEISSSPTDADIVKLLLPTYLSERYNTYSAEGRIDICPLMHEPRDFMYFDHLATLKDETLFICHHFNIFQDFSIERLNEFLRWREINRTTDLTDNGLQSLFIYLISTNEKDLKLSNKIVKALKKCKKVTLFKLIYSRRNSVSHSFYSLDEFPERDFPAGF